MFDIKDVNLVLDDARQFRFTSYINYFVIDHIFTFHMKFLNVLNTMIMMHVPIIMWIGNVEVKYLGFDYTYRLPVRDL